MIWIDLEGTIIDDLWNKNWMQDNISKIAIPQHEFGIFTWGWKTHDEIDINLVAAIENKLNRHCEQVITKIDCMKFAETMKTWTWNGNIHSMEAELSFNEKFDKEKAFIEMFKSEKNSMLFDDTIVDSKVIKFLDTDNVITLMKV